MTSYDRSFQLATCAALAVELLEKERAEAKERQLSKKQYVDTVRQNLQFHGPLYLVVSLFIKHYLLKIQKTFYVVVPDVGGRDSIHPYLNNNTFQLIIIIIFITMGSLSSIPRSALSGLDFGLTRFFTSPSLQTKAAHQVQYCGSFRQF
jgi:hypothetical protein